MLERRLTDAAEGVKEALTDLVPPPVTDLARATHTSGPSPVSGRSPAWRGPLIAAGTAAAILAIAAVSVLLLLPDGGESVIQPAPTTTVAAIEDDPVAGPTTIDAAWTLERTVEGWLTETTLVDGTYFAMHKDLGEGVAEGTILGLGDLWTSPDGVTWVPAEAGDQKPAAPADGQADGAAVEVRRNSVANEFGMLVGEGLWATIDGETWREIALRPSNDNWMPTVTAGGLGWVVYSPPMEAGVTEFEGNAYQGPRDGNLGLWYTPDTETWLEVTDLGPLADTIHQIGEAGVIDTTLIVEDNDILVYALIARNMGFGVVGDPRTEIWRLELSADTSPTTEETVPSTTSPAVADDGVASPDESGEVGWSPILSTTKARPAPAAATCPEGSNPNAPGPIDQVRPGEGPWSNQAAVFDTHQGRIVYVDEAGETWTFDVCTNIWRAMDPAFVPDAAHLGEGQLVYDIDSDRTIAFGPRNVYAYDAAANTWTRRGSPDGRDLRGSWTGAVYDPASGLVLVQFDDGMLVAYDVDTDTWAEIGTITEPREVTHEGQTQTVGPPFLIGHVAETDRLVFLGFNGAPFQDDGALINPRDGGSTPLEEPEGGVEGGFGSFRYATSGDTAYPYGDRGACRLDPTTLNWDCSSGGQGGAMSAAMVYDSINARVVVINNFCCTWPGSSVSDDVWAIDFDTDERIELLATANTRVETDGS